MAGLRNRPTIDQAEKLRNDMTDEICTLQGNGVGKWYEWVHMQDNCLDLMVNFNSYINTVEDTTTKGLSGKLPLLSGGFQKACNVLMDKLKKLEDSWLTIWVPKLYPLRHAHM